MQQRHYRVFVVFLAGVLSLALWSPGRAYGQSPAATISSPGDNATVSVGGGSQYMLVKVSFPSGYSPTSCDLLYDDPVGGPTVYASAVSWYFESPTGLYVAQVQLPTGTKSGLTVRVRGYRPSDSGGFPGGFCTGTSTNVTVTKAP